MNTWGVDLFFFHITPLLSIPSVKPNSTVTDSRGFFRAQQSFSHSSSQTSSTPAHSFNLKSVNTTPSQYWEHVCSTGLNVFTTLPSPGKKHNNSAGHAFTWQTLNRALCPAYERRHFTPYPPHISPPVHKGQRTLKTSTPNDYHRSCSHRRQRESQYNSNLHSVITFAWNFSMSLQLSVSFWICVH